MPANNIYDDTGVGRGDTRPLVNASNSVNHANAIAKPGPAEFFKCRIIELLLLGVLSGIFVVLLYLAVVFSSAKQSLDLITGSG